ncbi:MAG: hypothetical protein H0W88_12335 [Parachlamydiaceae bacterium]|nr:hypothetical protein [Parachlamydiaceae bacterium]
MLTTIQNFINNSISQIKEKIWNPLSPKEKIIANIAIATILALGTTYAIWRYSSSKKAFKPTKITITPAPKVNEPLNDPEKNSKEEANTVKITKKKTSTPEPITPNDNVKKKNPKNKPAPAQNTSSNNDQLDASFSLFKEADDIIEIPRYDLIPESIQDLIKEHGQFFTKIEAIEQRASEKKLTLEDRECISGCNKFCSTWTFLAKEKPESIKKSLGKDIVRILIGIRRLAIIDIDKSAK